LAAQCKRVPKEVNLQGGTLDARKEKGCKEEKEITCSGAKSPSNKFLKGK
jgi:hypothetical protein